jgi:hypothetical protein
MLKAIKNNVDNAYGPMKAATKMNPYLQKMYEGLNRVPGMITPEHPLLKKIEEQEPAQPAGPPPGYRRVTLKDGRRGFYNAETQDFLEAP